MNPARFAQMMKYLTRAKKTKPDLPDVFPASKAPIPPKTQNVEEIEAINRFSRDNPRTEKAGGGRIPFNKGERVDLDYINLTRIENAKEKNKPISDSPKFKYVPGEKNITYTEYQDKQTGEKFKRYHVRIRKNVNSVQKTLTKGKEFQEITSLDKAKKIRDDFRKANPKNIKPRDPKKDYLSKDIRRQFEKDLQGRIIDFGAPKGYTAHHMLPLAGKADVTDSDIAIISNKMNSNLSEFDKPMNALVNEAYALDFSKEGSLKRMDEINKELADIVKKAKKKLPKKYEGLIGFNKITPVLGEFDAKGNQVFDIERISSDYKKSIGQKKIGIPLRDIKRSEIRKLVSEAPTFGALDVPSMFKRLSPGARKLISGAGGFILPEVLFYQLDKRNRMSKGQSEKEAAAGALESGTLGAYENKAYMEELKKVAESMNIDSSSFDAAYQLNLLSKSFNQNNANYEKNYMQLLEIGDEKRAEDLKKNFDRYTKETQNKYSLLANNISDNVMNTVGASPLIMKEGRENITQEQFEKPFYNMRDTALEKLKREKQKAFDTQKRQVDTAAGSVGENFYQTFDSLTQGAKNILQGRVIPFASKIGLPQYEPLESDREREARYLKEMDPRELFLYNKERGFTYDKPITSADIENLQYENPGLFAGGGIAKLAGVSSGVAPESGPNPQGLLSLKNRVRNY